MADRERGYRAPFRAFGGGAGDRRLEIVSGKAFSAHQAAGYLATTSARAPHHRHNRSRSPDPPSRRGSNGRSTSSSVAYYSSNYSSSSSSHARSSGAWCFSDPEAKRRRRVVGYKVYAVEGKVKASLRKGIRWIKGKCSEFTRSW